MTMHGYASPSTVDQTEGLADQIVKLKEAGCTDYREKINSVKIEGRVEFVKVLAGLKMGDVLVFSSLSRAARSMIHMIEIEARVAGAGAKIRILDLSIDIVMFSWVLPKSAFVYDLNLDRRCAVSHEVRAILRDLVSATLQRLPKD